MWKTVEGSTGRLIQLCLGYFFFYTFFGVASKYFPGSAANGLPGMSQVAFLVYSTIGGTAVALFVVLAWRWYRLKTVRAVRCGRFCFPSELLYIVPSGILTAVVIPTTTLMYLLVSSVMVAMVIMRGSVIVISRVVDAIQIRQGLLDKKVYWEENVAVVFAILAVLVNIFLPADHSDGDSLEFVHNVPAMIVLASYIVAYSFRIYIMNYYKNTRGKGQKLDNKAFFAVEQIAASTTILLVGLLLYHAPQLFHAAAAFVQDYRASFETPHVAWRGAVVAGMFFGAVSFFSVFLFMFKGRTATFAGLVNRLTSLIAGTISTLLFAILFHGHFPKVADWVGLGLILVAIAFLSQSERKRIAELKARREIGGAAAAGGMA
jgi:hypothetical protein